MRSRVKILGKTKTLGVSSYCLNLGEQNYLVHILVGISYPMKLAELHTN